MQKLDLKKDLKHLYSPSAKQVSEVDVPPMNYLMIDAEGDPNQGDVLQVTAEALYSISYTVKFMSKQECNLDYVVMPLEGLWDISGKSLEEFDFKADKALFVWTLMVMQPDHITADMIQRATEKARQKKNPARLDDVRFESYHEGRSAQILHIGSYDDEQENVDKIDQYIADQGCVMAKRHHEIYLSDPRRTDPAKLKTVLRHPMKPA